MSTEATSQGAGTATENTIVNHPASPQAQPQQVVQDPSIQDPQGDPSQATSLTSTTPEPGSEQNPTPAPSPEDGQPAPADPDTEPTSEDGDGVAPFQMDESAFKALGFTEHDGEYWAIREEDPELGTIAYRSVDDLRQGAREKQRHILRVQTSLEEAQRQREAEAEARAKIERELGAMRQFVDTAQIEMARARELMVEVNPEFAKVTDRDQLTSDEDRRKFDQALIDARVKVQAERQALEAQEAQQQEQYKRVLQQADAYYNEKFDEKSVTENFGIRNPEEIGALQQFLLQPTGRTVGGRDVTVAEEFYHVMVRNGKAAADYYLEGVKAAFWNQYRPQAQPSRPAAQATPPPQQPAPTQQPPQQPGRVFQNENQPPAAPSTQPPQPRNAMDALRAGSAAQRERAMRQVQSGSRG